MINNNVLTLEFVGQADVLWRCTVSETNRTFDFAPPIFEIEGKPVTATAALAQSAAPVRLPQGVTEHRWAGPLTDDPHLTLEMVVRVADDSPVVRFCYRLHSQRPVRLTKASGQDSLTYFSTSFRGLPHAKEVRLAEFNEMVHSFCVSEREIARRNFENGLQVMGPILIGASKGHHLLLAYEHGSQVPDAFATYQLDAAWGVTLCAVKGNYYDGQVIDADHPYQTLWLHTAAVAGGEDDLAQAYRHFILHQMSANAESRRPYIFYNTWNFQERNKAWYGNPYLESMTQERILAEIDAAHQMGVDVYVIDTGWYEKTGDWRVNSNRFPDGLKSVKARLDGYGMKLGLWFNPTVAAVSSRMLQEHRDCLMSWHGKIADPHPVWETEASQGLCLVSRYADAFADELIRLVREVGVTYFKWDAIGQYGCDDPGHDHGTAQNSPQERADSYAFQLGTAMVYVVDKLCAACPDAIVDFDVTEGGRTVGLQFLSAGKYFLINNGPYNFDYDMPVPTDGNVNLFFFPGPARGWICRTPLTYDKWIPSVLFLTHYLPDDVYKIYGWGEPQELQCDANQWIALASLVLGQNGIWGDLLRVSDEGRARFGHTLALYKQVKDDITQATLVRDGAVGGSPETYEKIAPSGRGVVSVFANASGRCAYVTRDAVSRDIWHNDGVSVTFDDQGRARIETTFDKPSAKLVFFGVSSGEGVKPRRPE